MRPPNRMHRKLVDKNDVQPTEQSKNDSATATAAAAAAAAVKQSKVNSKLKLDERFCLFNESKIYYY